MKTCNKCRIEKPATPEYFHRNKTTKDGLIYTCKDCNREYREKRKAKNKKKKFIYDDKIMKTCNKCRIEKPATPEYFHRDKELKDGLATICKECVNKQKQNHYKENREEKLEYNKNHYLENPEVFRLKNQRRRARMAQLPHTLTLEEWEDALEFFDYSCAYCGVPEDNLEQEHVTPVVKGGGYTADNVIPACRTCNASKNARDMEEWYSEQEFFNIGRFILLNEWIKDGIREAERAMEEEKY